MLLRSLVQIRPLQCILYEYTKTYLGLKGWLEQTNVMDAIAVSSILSILISLLILPAKHNQRIGLNSNIRVSHFPGMVCLLPAFTFMPRPHKTKVWWLATECFLDCPLSSQLLNKPRGIAIFIFDWERCYVQTYIYVAGKKKYMPMKVLASPLLWNFTSSISCALACI